MLFYLYYSAITLCPCCLIVWTIPGISPSLVSRVRIVASTYACYLFVNHNALYGVHANHRLVCLLLAMC